MGQPLLQRQPVVRRSSETPDQDEAHFRHSLPLFDSHLCREVSKVFFLEKLKLQTPTVTQFAMIFRLINR